MAQQLALGIKLPDGARFENFFAGPNAEIVHQVRTLAPGQSLYLHGPVGSGRSHLLQAACQQWHARGAAVFYLPLATLPSTDPAMLEGLESAALVALDDVDAMAGVGAWEQALFHLFNRLRATGAAILMSAADRPDAVGLTLPDLVSRLTWGELYGLRPLDDAGRLAVLQIRAQQRGLELPDEVGEFLLKRTPRSLAALCELIDQLDEASLAAQRRLTIPFVKSVLAV